MRLLVTGPRDYTHKDMLWEVLDLLRPRSLIHGGARGFDTFAGEWCAARGIIPTVRKYPEGLGKAGGPLRNIAMLDLNPDIVLAGHSVIADSGTNHCVRAAISRGIPVLRLM